MIVTGPKNPAFKHGYAYQGRPRPNIYRRWQHMIQRCHNPNDRDYHKYGGRGIAVCDRWRKSFQAFLDDMGLPPSKAHSIDRVDNAGPYSPENCRWATVKQQANNRRSTKQLTIRGITRPLSEWCELANINSKTVLYRLKHMGMTHEEAIYTPLTWTKKKERQS